MKYIVVLLAVLFACTSASDRSGFESKEYIKFEYLGEHDYPFSALVISTVEIKKSQVETYEDYGDTLWIENIVVSKKLYSIVKAEIINLSKREGKVHFDELKEEEYKVGFSVDVVEDENIVVSDDIWSYESSKMYFTKLINGLNKVEGSELLREKLNDLYIERLFKEQMN
ncbi:hypothetical protein JMN32_15050 [Fulvivirga sp. 29W222]|uniref:Uncharacterized protein n=1 Tax=Fulvivirga marina TaxID=2494733 RepID=A0A937KCQ2_9BACT|nr:hypothetical protein [Fulvivirga marina]MBL6447634.1 hypothetical protein [Fulvivirga marina]